MTRFLAVVMIFAVGSSLAGPDAPGKDVEKQVRSFGTGSAVEVRLTDKTSLRGHLAAVEISGFSIRIGDSVQGSLRQVAFSDVKTIKLRSHTPVGAWIAMGVVVGVVAIAVAVFAIERHNE